MLRGHDPVRAASDRIALELAPGFGARITALTDRRSGRQWLVPGDPVGDPVGGAVFGAAQAAGWDECFPTVLPCADAARDHGELWGVPARMQGLRAEWQGPHWRFSRDLTLAGAELRADYEVTNTGTAPLHWMWSQHCLLALDPGERIALDGFDGFALDGQPIRWPWAGGRDLSRVAPVTDGLAAKIYARARGAVTARIDGPEGGIAFRWDGAQVPALGLWLDYGGWPADAPVHQVAIEPTTAPHNDLTAARAAGDAPTLAPGDLRRWSVTVTLTDPA